MTRTYETLGAIGAIAKLLGDAARDKSQRDNADEAYSTFLGKLKQPKPKNPLQNLVEVDYEQRDPTAEDVAGLVSQINPDNPYGRQYLGAAQMLLNEVQGREAAKERSEQKRLDREGRAAAQAEAARQKSIGRFSDIVNSAARAGAELNPALFTPEASPAFSRLIEDVYEGRPASMSVKYGTGRTVPKDPSKNMVEAAEEQVTVPLFREKKRATKVYGLKRSPDSQAKLMVSTWVDQDGTPHSELDPASGGEYQTWERLNKKRWSSGGGARRSGLTLPQFLQLEQAKARISGYDEAISAIEADARVNPLADPSAATAAVNRLRTQQANDQAVINTYGRYNAPGADTVQRRRPFSGN